MRLLRKSDIKNYLFDKDYKCCFLSEGLLSYINNVSIFDSYDNNRFLLLWTGEDKNKSSTWEEFKKIVDSLEEDVESSLENCFLITGDGDNGSGLYYPVNRLTENKNQKLIIFNCIQDYI